MLGQNRGDLVGKHNSAFVPKGYEDDVAAIARSLDSNNNWRGTLPLIRADGTQVDLEWSIAIHSIPGVRLAIITDITKRKQIEAERDRLLASERAARADAERASSLKDDFLATLSHELRTPLNAIVGWSEILTNEKLRNSEDISEGMDAIARNARAQAQLIDDLLDMSRIMSGKIALKVEKVNIGQVIRAAMTSVWHAAEAKHVEIIPDLPANLSDIVADPNRLQQVFWNLLLNAIKFTPKSGTVQVVARMLNAQVEVWVADSGEGIKPEFLPYIFDRFRQADATTTRTHGGLGLGLAISKNLVELHGGTIRAVSPGVGKGATFYVTLPVVAARNNVEEKNITPAASSVGSPAADQKIIPSLAETRLLVIDDEADARFLLKKVFTDQGGIVTVAVSATDALELLKTNEFDIIVSDIGMPAMDGYSFMQQVRTLPSSKGGATPAIALTAFARVEDGQRAREAGYQLHVSKPVEPSALARQVAELLKLA